MSEEQKEIKSSDKDKKELDKNEDAESEKDKEKSEEDESSDDFEKDSETVKAGKYNQAIRKQRELELENRELERKLAEKGQPKDEESASDEEEDEDDSFFEKKKEAETPDQSKLIDEKLKPVLETLKKKEENEKKVARTAFFEAHPEYLNDAEKWQELLDEMDNSLNPNSNDDHYTQLEKAHRILSADSYNAEIEDKKSEMAGDAASISMESGLLLIVHRRI